MSKQLPQTDSIRELATFWDSHDLTDFDDQIEEVTQPVFEAAPQAVSVPLTAGQAAALDELAEQRGIGVGSILQEWIAEHLSPSV